MKQNVFTPLANARSKASSFDRPSQEIPDVICQAKLVPAFVDSVEEGLRQESELFQTSLRSSSPKARR